MNRSFRAILALALSCLQPAVVHAVVVGVLEQPQCARPARTAVRPLFDGEGQRWTTLKSGEFRRGSTRWTVAFRGRSLGSIIAADSGRYSAQDWDPRNRLLSAISGQSIPPIANTDSLFGGECGRPADRPLVVVSYENYDAHDWRGSSSPRLREQIFPQFHAAAGKADTCGAGAAKSHFWNYGAADLIVSQCIGDTTGRMVARAELDGTRNHCKDHGAAAWSSYLFLLDQNVRLLGKDLTIVDFGDYDGDGAIEVLCWYSSRSEDGYTLFYDHLRRRIDYRWSHL